MRVELLKRKNIVVTLIKWSDNYWFIEVTREVKDKESEWRKCTTLKRTLPIYNLRFLNKVLKGDRYKNFFQRKALRLCKKYQKKGNE